MPFTIAGLNKMLDNLGAVEARLHDGYPDDAGDNELTIASPEIYSRQSIAFSAASAGAIDSSSQPAFDVPAGTTLRWVSLWDNSSPQTCLQFAPLGESQLTYTVDSGADTIDSTSHGLSNDDLVVFYAGTAPGGLTEGQVYHVINANANDFQVAATQGGSAINLTDTENGSKLSQIVPETYGAQGTFTLSDADLSLTR